MSLFSSYCFLANRDLGMLLAGQHLPTPLLSQYANVLGYSPVIPDYACACVHVKSLSCVQLPATLWAVACQALLSVGFSRQEYWSGFPCPPPGIFPIQGLNPCLLCLLHWQLGSLPQVLPGKPRASLVAHIVKNLPAMQETQV